MVKDGICGQNPPESRLRFFIFGYLFLECVQWEEASDRIREKILGKGWFYSARVLADKIYWRRERWNWPSDWGINLVVKPLGRLSAKAVQNHVSTGDRNPIEGNFGLAKEEYGMNRIRARLKNLNQSWIVSIILWFKLFKLAGRALFCLSFVV